MKESDVRDYLRQTKAEVYEAERRLERLQDLQFDHALRRRRHNTGIAWHATGTVAGVALIRREIKQQRERLAELQKDAEYARDHLAELEEQRRQEDAERDRQREEQRQRKERERAELEAELETERQQREQAHQGYQEMVQAFEEERTRAVELENDLANERNSRENAEQALGERGSDDPGPDPGRHRGEGPDDEGPEPSGGVRTDTRPRGPGPDSSGGGAATPPHEERDEYRNGRQRDDQDYYEREM